MTQVIARNRNKRSSINNTDMLITEMNKRKKICLVKLQKLSDRINILEGFKNQASGSKINLQDYLKSKGHDYRDFFAPMGYYTPNNMVVSADSENHGLTYHKGMNFNKGIGYHIPERTIVKEDDHQEITSSMFGMTWNPALNHYYPTTVFDSKAYSSAEGMGDTGMDMIGGLRMEDFANLTNENEDSEELTSMVQGLLEEEYDNVEGELDLIEDAQMQLYGGGSSFEGQKVESAKNLACRTKCAFRGKSKRTACENECDKKYKPSQKQTGRRDDREEREKVREEFRGDKKDCKAKRKSGELTQSQYRECLKKERKEKRSDIKDAGGNIITRGLRTVAKVTPILAISRGSVLLLVGDNTFGFATRVAPALLPDAQARELFRPEAIEKAKGGWKKVAKGWKNLGGDVEKLKSKIIEGYKKKPYKVARKSSFEGDYYEFEENSNFEGNYYEFEENSNFVEPLTTAGIIATGISTLTGLINAFTKGGGEKNPYKADTIPPDYKKGLEDGSVEDNPPTDQKAPVLDVKTGEWVEPSTGKAIDPLTGKYKDTIFGMNKWLAIGIGVAGVLGIFYVLKSKK